MIVILFNLLYLVFYMGFHCNGCVCESVKTQGKLKIKEVFAGSSQEAFPWSEACAQHMTGIRRIMTDGDSWFSRVFASVSRVRPSREIPTKYSVLPISHIWYTKSLPTLYIPTLPTYWVECFSERKPLPLPLRVRDCHTHNSLHNPLWFSLTPISPFPNSWEVDNPNTYYTHPKCKVRFWCCWKILEEAICLMDAIGLKLRDLES